MENKKAFVDGISQVLVGAPGLSIEKVEYEKYEKPSTGWTQEYVVVHYNGGAIACRCVNADSCGAIYQEIGKMLFGGYYDEVKDRDYFVNNSDWERTE